MKVDELIFLLMGCDRNLEVGVETHHLTKGIDTVGIHSVEETDCFLGKYIAIVPKNVIS